MATSVGSGTAARAQAWERYPWVSLFSGYENDRFIDQGPVTVTVPGGPFIDLRPGILLSRGLAPRTRLNLDAVLSWERFDNDENRSLLGAVANAEVRRRFGAMGRWRITAGTNYFGDSVQEELERVRLGGEAAIGLTGRRGFVELIAGIQWRRFPNLTTPDASGIEGTYTELGPSASLNGAFRPSRRLEISGYVLVQGTGARDPSLDSRSLLGQVGVRWQMIGPLELFGSALASQRLFAAFPSGEDTDTYHQFGVGVSWPIGRRVDLFARFATAEYTDVLGVPDDSDRFSLGVSWWPGGRGVREIVEPLTLDLPAADDAKRTFAGEPRRFELDAPGAREVSIVGDFNGWDPRTNPMRRAGNGHWDTTVALHRRASHGG
jgi:hypothetical protein